MINFNKEVNRKGTFCTQWDYVEDRFGKSDLLPFTISDMDLESPQEIVQALIDRCNHKVFGYSRWNHDEFKNAIKKWYKRYDLNVNSDWIVYSPSVMYSVAKILELKSQENDGVAILTPAYDAFYKTIKANNRKVQECLLECIEGEYKIDFERFEEVIKKSKIFLFCNPHNPTGRVWVREEIEKIIDICKRNEVFIISDDIHMDITYKNKYTPVFSISDYNEMVILTSASKSFNIPALTGSYGLIKDKNLRERFLFTIKDKEAVSSPSILAVIGTIVAYEQCDYWLEELLNHTKENIEFVKKYLEDNIKELKVRIPEGCYFSWINFEELNITSEEFQNALIEKGNVAIMPGKTYGGNSEKFLRLNVACSRKKLEDGLNRLKIACDYIKSERGV